MHSSESNNKIVIVSLLYALGLWLVLPTGVEAQPVPESIAKQLKPVKLLDSQSCTTSVPDNFALMEHTVTSQPPLADRQIKRLSAEDVLSENELLEYLANRASAPTKDAQLHGMVTIGNRVSGSSGIPFSINGAVSLRKGYIDLKVAMVDTDKITRESETGNYVVTLHDVEGLVIDQFNFSLSQVVYLLGYEDIQERVVNVELIKCESLVSWGFKVAQRTFVLESEKIYFDWMLIADVATNKMEISDGAQNTQQVVLK